MSSLMLLLALSAIGVEPPEGSDPKAVLDETLLQYGLSSDQFLTENACFTIGYHRGLSTVNYGDEQIPSIDGKPISALEAAAEAGYSLGLEARDVKLTPPPSLVFAGWKANAIKPGEFDVWAAGLDLSGGYRLSVALTVGSGKNSRVIPAGMPVDVLARIVKDGVDSVVVTYDGLPLLVPNPADAPRIVSAAAEVVQASAKKARVVKEKKNADGTVKTPKAAGVRAPTLRDAIIHVLEGRDGGPGPLAMNGQIASRVRSRCIELGIGDKANTFTEKADVHVGYYLNIYKPIVGDDGVVTGPGRWGVEQPLLAVVLKTEARKYYVKGEGLSAEARYAQIPVELRAKIEAAGNTVITVPVATPAADAAPAVA